MEPPFIPDLPEDIEELVGFDKDCETMSLEEEVIDPALLKKLRKYEDEFKDFET